MPNATTATTLSCEREPPQRRVLASIQVSVDTWWSGAVTMPDDGDVTPKAVPEIMAVRWVG
jgi:hypothetical protein